jgi:hypothetical protein
MVQDSKMGRCFAGACLLWLACCSSALGVYSPFGGQQVTLGWTASPDPTVVGYNIYYGTSSGVYTNKINVGTNTVFAVNGLYAGTTYYFNITSYNAANVESAFNSEIPFVVPGVLALSQNPTNFAMRILFPVAAGQSYQLQASSNLESWSNIWSTSIQTTNEWLEYDEPVTNTIPKRFYRLILGSP